MSQLSMRRPNLDDLPALPRLPEAYAIRPGTPDDAEGVASLLTRSFQEPWDSERASNVLLQHPDVWVTFVVEHDGKVVATASCKHLNDQQSTGYVHYVGADPEYAGQALGYIVSLATLHEFVRAGKSDAILDTDDPRLPALRTYLRLGFIPEYLDDTHPPRWSKVFAAVLTRR